MPDSEPVHTSLPLYHYLYLSSITRCWLEQQHRQNPVAGHAHGLSFPFYQALAGVPNRTRCILSRRLPGAGPRPANQALYSWGMAASPMRQVRLHVPAAVRVVLVMPAISSGVLLRIR